MLEAGCPNAEAVAAGGGANVAAGTGAGCPNIPLLAAAGVGPNMLVPVGWALAGCPKPNLDACPNAVDGCPNADEAAGWPSVAALAGGWPNEPEPNAEAPKPPGAAVAVPKVLGAVEAVPKVLGAVPVGAVPKALGVAPNADCPKAPNDGCCGCVVAENDPKALAVGRLKKPAAGAVAVVVGAAENMPNVEEAGAWLGIPDPTAPNGLLGPFLPHA